jgi:glyceraldehyde 3-phosphate dehydrogenase
MTPVRVAINGFGRIGRSVLRIGLLNRHVEFVAINDVVDAPVLAHLFAYDSLRGRLPVTVDTDTNNIIIDGRRIATSMTVRPGDLPWGALDVDIVLESTGKFTSREAAEAHLAAGARKVVISAPARDPDVTMVFGINEEIYDKTRHHIISMASCTTNCLAPVAKILDREFGIESGFITTVHGYTNDQALHDGPHGDLRRGRAAGLSIIPTRTTAIDAIAQVMPEIEGRLKGLAIRVPTPGMAVVDLVATLKKTATTRTLHETLKAYAQGPMKGVLSCSSEPEASIDYSGNSNSSVVDLAFTSVIGGNMAKVLSWYDNEWGFSNRMCELFPFIMA